LQPGNANPATAERERPPTIRGERVTGVGRFHLGDAELRDRAGAIRDPVQALVMKGDQDAIAREMDISLQVPVPESHRDLEGRQRVLGRLTRTTSVGERDRSRLDEKRVHVPPQASHLHAREARSPSPDHPGEARCPRQPPQLRSLPPHPRVTQRLQQPEPSVARIPRDSGRPRR
jgi:hypothetical protein